MVRTKVAVEAKPSNPAKRKVDSDPSKWTVAKLSEYCYSTLEGRVCIDPQSGRPKIVVGIKEHADKVKVKACKILTKRIANEIIEGKPTEWSISPSLLTPDEEKQKE